MFYLIVFLLDISFYNFNKDIIFHLNLFYSSYVFKVLLHVKLILFNIMKKFKVEELKRHGHLLISHKLQIDYYNLTKVNTLFKILIWKILHWGNITLFIRRWKFLNLYEVINFRESFSICLFYSQSWRHCL